MVRWNLHFSSIRGTDPPILDPSISLRHRQSDFRELYYYSESLHALLELF